MHTLERGMIVQIEGQGSPEPIEATVMLVQWANGPSITVQTTGTRMLYSFGYYENGHGYWKMLREGLEGRRWTHIFDPVYHITIKELVATSAGS